MTQRKDFKKVVRDRMAETGETYTAARAALEPPEPPQPLPTWSLRELLSASISEAQRLESSYLGPEHALVALVRATEELPATQALLAAGMTVAIAEGGVSETAPAKQITTNPRWHSVYGRAEGISFGVRIDATAEQFLVAMLWDDTCWTRWEDQVPRDAVIAELRRRGVVMPSSPAPSLDRWAPTQVVDVAPEKLEAVINELSRLRETNGVRFGFNHRPDGTAFVTSDDKVDLAAIVAATSTE